MVSAIFNVPSTLKRMYAVLLGGLNGPPRYCFQTPAMSSAFVAIRSHGPVTPAVHGTSAFAMLSGKPGYDGTADLVAAWVACKAFAYCIGLARLLAVSSTNNMTTPANLINPDLIFITSLPLL